MNEPYKRIYQSWIILYVKVTLRFGFFFLLKSQPNGISQQVTILGWFNTWYVCEFKNVLFVDLEFKKCSSYKILSQLGRGDINCSPSLRLIH